MVGQAITIVILSIKLLKDSRCATRRKKSNLPSYQSTCQTDKKQVSIVAEINNVRFLRQFLNKMGKVREERSVANRALAPVCKHILRFVVGSKQGINVHIAFLV
jgi:ribosomal protein S18